MAALIAPIIALVESVEKEESKLSENSHILSNTTDEKFLILSNQFAEDRINPQVARMLTNQELEILDLTSRGSNLDAIANKLSLPKSRIKIEILKITEKLQSSYDREKVKVRS